jgi:hypothetical protein
MKGSPQRWHSNRTPRWWASKWSSSWNELSDEGTQKRRTISSLLSSIFFIATVEITAPHSVQHEIAVYSVLRVWLDITIDMWYSWFAPEPTFEPLFGSSIPFGMRIPRLHARRVALETIATRKSRYESLFQVNKKTGHTGSTNGEDTARSDWLVAAWWLAPCGWTSPLKEILYDEREPCYLLKCMSGTGMSKEGAQRGRKCVCVCVWKA